MNKPHTHATKLKSKSLRRASPQVQGGRAAEKRDPVRLSVRNSDANHTTGAVHLLTLRRRLKGRMAKGKKAADQAAVECRVRVVTKPDGRQVIEIEIPDEEARLRLAAALLRDGR